MPKIGMELAAPSGADRRDDLGDRRARLARRHHVGDRRPRRRVLGAGASLFRRQGRVAARKPRRHLLAESRAPTTDHGAEPSGLRSTRTHFLGDDRGQLLRQAVPPPRRSQAWLAFYVEAQKSTTLRRLLRVYARRLHSNLVSGLTRLTPRTEAERSAEATAAMIDGLYIRRALKEEPRTPPATARRRLSRNQTPLRLAARETGGR